jgi:hypothetical protein
MFAKHFFFVTITIKNKLDCLPLPGLFSLVKYLQIKSFMVLVPWSNIMKLLFLKNFGKKGTVCL